MTLNIGSKAPDFTLPATQGQSVTLSDLQGSPVVLYFYPKDDTPGCTQEACDFRDSITRLKQIGAVVLGVSKDSVTSHEKFAEKYKLNFPLLSDEDGKTIKDYGVWAEKSMFGKKYMGIERTTFLIDTDSRIARIWNKVKVEGHVDEILEAINALATKKAA
jgi:thioredoxin-dependent peroxiredoxin